MFVFFHLLWKNSAECYAFCSAEYQHYIKIMISLLVLGRTAISVQPYNSLNVAVQVDWQERHWKSSSINWVRLWQPEHFLFPHNNMMAHKPTFRGQRKDSNYLKYTLKNVLRAKRGLSWHSEKGLWTILANKMETWRRQINYSWYPAEHFLLSNTQMPLSRQQVLTSAGNLKSAECAWV